MNSPSSREDMETRDGEILADLFDELLQHILEGRTPDLSTYLPHRPDLRDRIAKTWALACSVAGRREPSRPVLGGYEVLRELGHGGMGTVYLARHQILQRECAIKVLPHSLAMSPRAKQRFLEEAKALARIHHDGVVHIHRILDHSEMLAFEMEFIEGKSLQQLVADLRELPKPLTMANLASCIGVGADELTTRNPVEWFVHTIVRVARALGEVHRHGLIHRDVKPSNVLLRGDGSPVLADFGLARVGDLGATQTGAFAGTPVYAAPERLRGGDTAVDARTDVYSLGVTLYELLTLEAPFAGSTTHEVLRRIESGALSALRTRAPHVSRDLAVVVQKAMEPDPRHRYASADAFADDLERLLRLEPILARPAGPLRRAVQFVRRNQRTAIAGLVGATLVAIAAWPFAVHADQRQRARQLAEQQLAAARSQLLSPETLHLAWARTFAGSTLQPLQDPKVRRDHLAALAATVRAYDRVLELDPSQPDAPRERAAVANALASLDHEGAAASASLADALAAGLAAFLLGDSDACHRAWDALDPVAAEQPFVSACQALQLSADGFAERAYPRLFHATRSFPEAGALALALADAALAMGDSDLAEEWLRRVPEPKEEQFTWARRQLLAADLAAAKGAVEAAGTTYRGLARRDISDPVPLQRLGMLFLARGDAGKAEDVLERLLKRWPELAQAHRDLAWIRLQRHDLAGFLAEVRFAASCDRRHLSRAAANALDEVLAMADLPVADAAVAAHMRRAKLPLAAWLPAHVVRSITRALEVVRVVDTEARVAAAVDGRPYGAALLTLWWSAMRLPQALVQLPGAAALTVLIAPPLLLGAPTDIATSLSMPFQKILGDTAVMVQPTIVVQGRRESPDCEYGTHLVVAGDVDGDTQADLCIVSTVAAGSRSHARIEITSLAGGSPVRTLRAPRDDVDFARGFAVLGDADGDFCDDLAIGSPARNGEGPGCVELRSGRTDELLWRRDEGAAFGRAIATVADHDGDGVKDLLVGMRPDSANPRSPCAALLSGRTGATLRELRADGATSGLGSCVADLGDLDGDGVTDFGVSGSVHGQKGLAITFSGRTGEVLHRFADDAATSCFGDEMLGLGDVDGDGNADFAITAPGYLGRQFHKGRVDIVSGSTGKLIHVLSGERVGECFGVALCRVPEWLRRGKPALAVTALRGGPTGSGYVRVFDLATGRPVQTVAGTPLVRLLAPSLAALGDRDGDGMEDLGMAVLLRSGRCLVWSVSFAMVSPR